MIYVFHQSGVHLYGGLLTSHCRGSHIPSFCHGYRRELFRTAGDYGQSGHFVQYEERKEEKTCLVNPCNVQDLGVFMYMLDGQTL